MLTPKLIPTPLVHSKEHKPVPIVEPRSTKYRSSRVALGFIGLILSLLKMRLTGRWTPGAAAQRVRETIEKVGFLWIKAGQILSLRPDFFGQALCSELAKLQYQAEGFSPEISRELIEEELGGPIEAFFDEYEEHPFAAASIAQVHRARLRREQASVVIKVMRPDAEGIFRKDLNLFNFLVRLLNLIPFLKQFRFNEAIWELREIFSEEVDYRYEVTNIQRFRKSTRKHKGVYVPKAFRKYSTQRVLVMEKIEGPLMSDYLALHTSDPQRLASWREENNVSPKKVATRLLMSFMRQIYEDNLFHGDLHPGNIILLRDSHFALIDLGSLGTAEGELLTRYHLLVEAFSTGQYRKAADLMLSFAPELPVIDLVQVKEDTVRVLRSWEMRTGIKALPYHEKSLSYLLEEIVKVLGKYRIMTTWGFMRIDRSFTTLDASLNDLLPTANYVKIFVSYFKQSYKRSLKNNFNLKAFKSLAVRVPSTLAEYKLYLEPRLRRDAQMFKAGIGKVHALFATIFLLGHRLIFLAGLFIVATFLYQHYGFLQNEQEGLLKILREAMDAMPKASQATWLLIVFLDLYLYLPIRRLRKNFSEPEIRLPGNTRASS